MTKAYTAAHETCAWRNCSHFGRFIVRGADAATLLHHLTTNDIKGLKPGASCEAALINHKGRVLDWLTIWRLEDGFFVITSPNRRAIFQPHAQKFILFRQDVTIKDVSDAETLWGVFGKTLPRPLPTGGETTRLPFGGFFLRDTTPPSDAVLCDDATYNILRIEAGLPVAGLELTEAINPWEAGLDFAISLHKGCYNGQEVIARLNTYKKVKQGLMGLKTERPIAELPAKLTADGRDAGFATSSVQSPSFGAITLAFVRGDYQTPGQVLTVSDGQIATVCELPF